jgi:hypothetical protein
VLDALEVEPIRDHAVDAICMAELDATPPERKRCRCGAPRGLADDNALLREGIASVLERAATRSSAGLSTRTTCS